MAQAEAVSERWSPAKFALATRLFIPTAHLDPTFRPHVMKPDTADVAPATFLPPLLRRGALTSLLASSTCTDTLLAFSLSRLQLKPASLRSSEPRPARSKARAEEGWAAEGVQEGEAGAGAGREMRGRTADTNRNLMRGDDSVRLHW